MNDVAELLKEAANLSSQAAALAGDGNINGALRLEQQADELRSRARSAARHVDRTLPPSHAGRGSGDGRGPSTRTVTISSLNEIGVPASPRAVAEYASARFDTHIDPRLLAALRRDERKAWASPRSHRPAYVVPALEGTRFLAVRGKLALSDWPLERRLIGPWSERADHLTATVNLARNLGWLADAQPDDAIRLARLVAGYAATIPGAVDDGAEVDPARVEEAARAELAILSEHDTSWRAKTAARARQHLTEDDQLWGAPPPEIVRHTSS